MGESLRRVHPKRPDGTTLYPFRRLFLVASEVLGGRWEASGAAAVPPAGGSLARGRGSRATSRGNGAAVRRPPSAVCSSAVSRLITLSGSEARSAAGAGVRRHRHRREVAGPLGVGADVLRQRGPRSGEVLQRADVPVPIGRPAHGAPAQLRVPRPADAVSPDAGLQRPGADGMGLLWSARRERRHPDRHPSPRLHRGADRPDEGAVAPSRCRLRLGPRAGQPHPGVLPLGPVAVPAVVRAWPGVQEDVAGQLVSQRPDRAGQRTGGRRTVRAVRSRGGEARSRAVVLPHHRLRRPVAGRPRPTGRVARPGPHHAGELDRPLRGADLHHGSGRDREHLRGLHHPARHGVRDDLRRARPRASPGRPS